MMHALRPEAVAAKSDLAVWLASGYEPQPSAIGVQASAEGGAAGYPMSPWMGLMQNALGENLAPFLQGSVSAEETLETIEAAYVSAARSQGFLD